MLVAQDLWLRKDARKSVKVSKPRKQRFWYITWYLLVDVSWLGILLETYLHLVHFLLYLLPHFPPNVPVRGLMAGIHTGGQSTLVANDAGCLATKILKKTTHISAIVLAKYKSENHFLPVSPPAQRPNNRRSLCGAGWTFARIQRASFSPARGGRCGWPASCSGW